MNQTCTKCNKLKDRKEKKPGVFIGKWGGKWSKTWCPECTSEYHRNYRLNNQLIKGGYGYTLCKICGVNFERKSSRHAYCSLECKEKR